MVRSIFEACSESEWEGILSKLKDQSLLHTPVDAHAKTVWGPWQVARGVFTMGGDVVGCGWVLIMPLPIVGGGLESTGG
jgi:hypothetical protein